MIDPELLIDSNPRVKKAIDELKMMIHERYPTATFAATKGDDPTGMYLTATVDLEDPDEVMDLVIDRLLELQVDEELPIHVLPVRPWKRVMQSLQPHVSMQQGLSASMPLNSVVD